MTKRVVIVDAHWRQLDELFAPSDLEQLRSAYDIVWGQDAPIPDDVLAEALPSAEVLISAEPHVDAEVLATATRLRAVIEVSGAFPGSIDYDTCAARGVEVLSCAPGFREAVAEMALGMAIAGARGIVAEHQAFGHGSEAWLSDQTDRDFTLFDAPVGFVGFGSIGREIAKLLTPFRCRIKAYDPWLPAEIAARHGADLATLQEVMEHGRCTFVAAAPSCENAGLVNAEALAQMPHGALLVVISRAHLVNFSDVIAAVKAGRIKAAIDVFPSEPVGADDPIRQIPGMILSPHRAAAVAGGRQLIGRLILSDLEAMFEGRAERGLQVARAETVRQLAGVGDAAQVADMASKR